MILKEMKKSLNATFMTSRKPLPSLTASPESTSARVCVLIMGANAEYCEETYFHLATAGLKLVPVLLEEAILAETIRATCPALVLIDWDTLGETSLKTCLFLRNYLLGRSTPIAIISREARNDGSIMRSFSSGADDFIEDAAKPRLLLSRIKALLRVRSTPSGKTSDAEDHAWISSQAV